MKSAHHLLIDADAVAGNGGRGRVFFLPGSVSRARMISEHFDDRQVFDNPRGLTVFTGSLSRGGTRVDVGTCPTGMGCPSIGIVATELMGLGVRRLLRVGTSGSLVPGRVLPGDLVIATAAVRDEGSSDAFAPREVPALAHPDWVEALSVRARLHGVRAFRGPVHTKDSLYGREYPAGPLAGANHAYMAVLRDLGVLASDMESSHLFMLAMVHGPDPSPVGIHSPGLDVIKAGSLLAVIGDEEGFADAGLERRAELAAIELALDAAAHLIRLEGDPE